jgi:FixJ family two-component response regulator
MRPLIAQQTGLAVPESEVLVIHDSPVLGAVAVLQSVAPTDQDIGARAVLRMSQLSPREREVLRALVDGDSNKIIAFTLGISARTVEVHRARMMIKLGVRHFAEAVRIAVNAEIGNQPPDAVIPPFAAAR